MLRMDNFLIAEDLLNYVMSEHWFSCINTFVRLGKGINGKEVMKLV